VKVSSDQEVVTCDRDFLHQVEQLSGEKVSHCNQCAKCTAGCPVAFAMDRPPHQIIRFIQLGMREQALSNATIWLCVACQTCLTRCPREIDLPRVMDALHTLAIQAGIKPKEPQIPLFHRMFLDSIRSSGRLNELPLMAKLGIMTHQPFKDLGLGIKMFLRGKLGFAWQKIANRNQLREMFKATQAEDKK